MIVFLWRETLTDEEFLYIYLCDAAQAILLPVVALQRGDGH